MFDNGANAYNYRRTSKFDEYLISFVARRLKNVLYTNIYMQTRRKLVFSSMEHAVDRKTGVFTVFYLFAHIFTAT